MKEVILKLFDEDYVKELFRKKVLPRYPEFKEIKRVKIIPIKNNVWKNSYHVVLRIETAFADGEGKVKKVPVYCSAHSHEPRRNVYSVLRFLWKHNFSRGYLTSPRPLFYSSYFRAVFYGGVKGENLYHYIKKGDFETAHKVTGKAAAWLCKFHKLPLEGAFNFNKQNSRVRTVIPGEEHILNAIGYFYPEYHSFYSRAYKHIREREARFLAASDRRWLVHGDAHPENVIKISEKKVAFIDYADVCLGDFARDLGSFIQQLDYMGGVKAGYPRQASELKDTFLNNYKYFSGISVDPALRERMDVYYYWTAMRTATHFLLRHNYSREKAKPLLEEVEKYLNNAQK